MITAQVWDERRCWVREGPTASDTRNNGIKWAEIFSTDGKLETIPIAAPFVTSRTFAGPDLKTLIITSERNGNQLETDEAGMTFISTPGVSGRITTLYPS